MGKEGKKWRKRSGRWLGWRGGEERGRKKRAAMVFGKTQLTSVQRSPGSAFPLGARCMHATCMVLKYCEGALVPGIWSRQEEKGEKNKSGGEKGQNNF